MLTQNHPHYDTELQVVEFLEPSSDSKICWKDSQDSLNTVTFMVMVFHGKGIQTKSSQESGGTEKDPGRVQKWSAVLVEPWMALIPLSSCV